MGVLGLRPHICPDSWTGVTPIIRGPTPTCNNAGHEDQDLDQDFGQNWRRRFALIIILIKDQSPSP